MNEIYYYSPSSLSSLSAKYLRPAYPIQFERNSAPESKQAIPPVGAALATGVADGFFWLLKVLTARPSATANGATAQPGNPDDAAAQRRTRRLLGEVPATLVESAPSADRSAR